MWNKLAALTKKQQATPEELAQAALLLEEEQAQLEVAPPSLSPPKKAVVPSRQASNTGVEGVTIDTGFRFPTVRNQEPATREAEEDETNTTSHEDFLASLNNPLEALDTLLPAQPFEVEPSPNAVLPPAAEVEETLSFGEAAFTLDEALTSPLMTANEANADFPTLPSPVLNQLEVAVNQEVLNPSPAAPTAEDSFAAMLNDFSMDAFMDAPTETVSSAEEVGEAPAFDFTHAAQPSFNDAVVAALPVEQPQPTAGLDEFDFSAFQTAEPVAPAVPVAPVAALPVEQPQPIAGLDEFDFSAFQTAEPVAPAVPVAPVAALPVEQPQPTAGLDEFDFSAFQTAEPEAPTFATEGTPAYHFPEGPNAYGDDEEEEALFVWAEEELASPMSSFSQESQTAVEPLSTAQANAFASATNWGSEQDPLLTVNALFDPMANMSDDDEPSLLSEPSATTLNPLHTPLPTVYPQPTAASQAYQQVVGPHDVDLLALLEETTFGVIEDDESTPLGAYTEAAFTPVYNSPLPALNEFDEPQWDVEPSFSITLDEDSDGLPLPLAAAAEALAEVAIPPASVLSEPPPALGEAPAPAFNSPPALEEGALAPFNPSVLANTGPCLEPFAPEDLTLVAQVTLPLPPNSAYQATVLYAAIPGFHLLLGQMANAQGPQPLTLLHTFNENVLPPEEALKHSWNAAVEDGNLFLIELGEWQAFVKVGTQGAKQGQLWLDKLITP